MSPFSSLSNTLISLNLQGIDLTSSTSSSSPLISSSSASSFSSSLPEPSSLIIEENVSENISNIQQLCNSCLNIKIINLSYTTINDNDALYLCNHMNKLEILKLNHCHVLSNIFIQNFIDLCNLSNQNKYKILYEEKSSLSMNNNNNNMNDTQSRGSNIPIKSSKHDDEPKHDVSNDISSSSSEQHSTSCLISSLVLKELYLYNCNNLQHQKLTLLAQMSHLIGKTLKVKF